MDIKIDKGAMLSSNRSIASETTDRVGACLTVSMHACTHFEGST